MAWNASPHLSFRRQMLLSEIANCPIRSNISSASAKLPTAPLSHTISFSTPGL
jgi:hypothetical protein